MYDNPYLLDQPRSKSMALETNEIGPMIEMNKEQSRLNNMRKNKENELLAY